MGLPLLLCTVSVCDAKDSIVVPQYKRIVEHSNKDVNYFYSTLNKYLQVLLVYSRRTICTLHFVNRYMYVYCDSVMLAAPGSEVNIAALHVHIELTVHKYNTLNHGLCTQVMHITHNIGRRLISDKLKLRCTSRRFHCVVHRERLPLLRIGVECCECPATIRHEGGSDVSAGQCPQAPDITRAAQLTTLHAVYEWYIHMNMIVKYKYSYTHSNMVLYYNYVEQ